MKARYAGERQAGREPTACRRRGWIPAAAIAAWSSIACLFAGPDAAAQATLAPFSFAPGRVAITERSDFSKYVDGRYIGHVYREARLIVEPASAGSAAYRYLGEALVFEETTRDERTVARRLSGAMPVAYSVGPAGISYEADEGYPILRGLPASPPSAASPGARWTGEGVVVVRPRPDRPATRVGVLVEYEYAGPVVYAGREARSIRARYALRYRGGDRKGDTSLVSIEGGRVADIVVAADDGSTLFVRETVDEAYAFSDGPPIRLKGFILHFHAAGSDAARDRIAAAVAPVPSTGAPSTASPAGPPGTGSGSPGVAAGGSAGVAAGGSAGVAAGGAPTAQLGSGGAVQAPGDTPAAGPGSAEPPSGASAAAIAPPPAIAGSAATPYELGRSARGVVLLLYDLRFAADSDVLLATEKARLDAIAAALARIPDKSFLVEGHAADLGKAAGQYELSERRARRVVDELVSRGLPAGRFIYRGLGADRPVAPNDTEANRARNRRVEITILD